MNFPWPVRDLCSLKELGQLQSPCEEMEHSPMYPIIGMKMVPLMTRAQPSVSKRPAQHVPEESYKPELGM